MFILTIRTDKPAAEIGLYKDNVKLKYVIWQADRQLSKTIHQRILAILEEQKYSLADLKGIAIFKGPGSFTGLRIGISVANALAYGLDIPIVAAKGDVWISEAVQLLIKGENERIVLPEYGSLPHITKPKK
jgi:tRNA threonylcarbamoyladenosine biosynthesis protein TsaB